VGITLLLPGLFYIYALAALLGLGGGYAEERTRLEPRVARLAGMLEEREAVLAQSNSAAEALAERVYPAQDDVSALSASLQSRVRQLFADAGMQVRNSQVLPPRDREHFQQVAIKVTVEGTLPALDAALAAVARERPRLLVESFETYPARYSRMADGDGQVLTVVMEIFALRVSA